MPSTVELPPDGLSHEAAELWQERIEVELIIAATAKRHRLILQRRAGTGMRVGEACELRWQDVDYRACRLRVQRGKTAAAKRWVPISDELMAAVQW
jgi:integrase